MKLQKLYIVSIIIVMLSAISFDVSSLKFADNTLETKIEVSVEEKKSETKSDTHLILSDSGLRLHEIKVFYAYDTSLSLFKQLYLNDIFKPPIFS